MRYLCSLILCCHLSFSNASDIWWLLISVTIGRCGNWDFSDLFFSGNNASILPARKETFIMTSGNFIHPISPFFTKILILTSDLCGAVQLRMCRFNQCAWTGKGFPVCKMPNIEVLNSWTVEDMAQLVDWNLELEVSLYLREQEGLWRAGIHKSMKIVKRKWFIQPGNGKYEHNPLYLIGYEFCVIIRNYSAKIFKKKVFLSISCLHQ